MTSSNTRRRPHVQEYPRHLRDAARLQGFAQPPQRRITTTKAKTKSKSVLSSLALAKTAEYQKRKQKLVEFTEKMMKKKISKMIMKYIQNNGDTIWDFITQLEHHPAVERAFIIEGLRKRYQFGLRILVDVKLPKTSLPDIDPIPPEVLAQFKTKIKSHIMDFVKTTPTTKRRIFIDLFHDNFFRVQDISAPRDPYFGAAAEYYSTFTDAHLGIRSANTGLSTIPIIQSGLKDDVLLAILKNLNGKNYCATKTFKKVCDKIRSKITQSSRELTPFVSFPERSDSPDPENPNPIIRGVITNKINLYKFLPILLSSFYSYLSGPTAPTETAGTYINELIAYLDTLLKSAPRTDPQRALYHKHKVLKVGVKLKHLVQLVDKIDHNIVGKTVFAAFCRSAVSSGSSRAEFQGATKYLKENYGRTNVNFDNPNDVKHIFLTCLTYLSSQQLLRFHNDQLRVLESSPDLRYIFNLILDAHIRPVVATPTVIPSSDVLNIPPSEVSTLPPSERIISAELVPERAGVKKI